ncbi:MAG: STAS domain-containing protein [Lachnospiraceae bacterium]|jgi:anti-sigma B factor antagonist|nr:STAS domain-containing protein [Lachnospiraceae bacterium]
MEIKMEKNLDKLVIALSGRLDTTTAPELEEKFKSELSDVTELVVDLAELEYISSAGLRVLLLGQKTMSKQGKMVVKNANESIMEIFDVTGFSDILNIE